MLYKHSTILDAFACCLNKSCEECDSKCCKKNPTKKIIVVEEAPSIEILPNLKYPLYHVHAPVHSSGRFNNKDLKKLFCQLHDYAHVISE